jgi:hypothetical protein
MERSRGMRNLLRTATLVVVASLLAIPAWAQLTTEQKVHDFENIAGTYAKRYAPYEWKKELFGFDALAIDPWLDRIRQSVDDLEFFEIVLEYVASLDDTHSSYSMPSSFLADLGFYVDIYDDKVVIENINRTRLPQAQFPFQIGDELVSMDGKASEDWIAEFSRFFKRGNPRSTRRSVADLLTFRPQARVPRTIDLPDDAVVVIARQNGNLETYTVPWLKTGVPLRWMGPVQRPESVGQSKTLAQAEGLPSYFDPWLELTNFRLPENDFLLAGETVSDDTGAVVPRRYVLGLGSRIPVFAAGLPAGFQLHRGLGETDFHFSGVYESDGYRIGYLRLPNFAPQNAAAALLELQTEVAFFQQNTDGLVVDVMRNTGGGCYMHTVASYLTPYPFYFFGEEVRVTISRINGIQSALEAARRAGAPQFLIDIYTGWLKDLEEAYRRGSGRTAPIPACTLQTHGNEPARDGQGNLLAYTKPLIVLIDEFSISAGDIFPAMMQDNGRGPLVGTRTNGAGGSVTGFVGGTYSESIMGNTNSLVTRLNPVEAPGYPVTSYIENVGSHADIPLDYMTMGNLLTGGRPFVDTFTWVLVEQIRWWNQGAQTQSDDQR